MDDKSLVDALAHIEAARSFIIAQARLHEATALTENALREIQKGIDLLSIQLDQQIPDNIVGSPKARRIVAGE
jgi:hypothetical protein